jgi:hypothetical protein
MIREFCFFLAVVYASIILPNNVGAQPIQPGDPVSYKAMYPERWQQKRTSLNLFPWEGKHIVVLTTKKDLDPEIMRIFVDRLDAGWELYGNLVKSPPGEYELVRGKVPVAMVPDASYTCGIGCGNVGATGIEIAGFYRDHFGGPGDYDLVKRNRKVFQHYYFFEFGRNWNSPGRRHSHFGTGYAVLMRYVCLDTLGYVDEDKKTRTAIERGEEIFANSKDSFIDAFFNPQVKTNKPLDLNGMYASMMLKLHRENGGNEWLKRYFDYLFECPEFNGPRPQILNWVICASCAAKKDLTPLFVDRWRFPIPRASRQVLSEVDWTAKDLNPYQILMSLPMEDIPPVLAAMHPEFLTAELRKGNLLRDASFEGADGTWRRQVFQPSGAKLRPVTGEFHDGKRSLCLENTTPNDTKFFQSVTVKPKTSYLLCGWIKTEGVKIQQKGGLSGALLNINGTWDNTMTFVGDHDWTYLATVVNSGDKTSLEVCARLGFTSSVTTGKAWFDDIVFVELPQKK